MKINKIKLILIALCIFLIQHPIESKNIRYTLSQYKLKQGETLRIDIKTTHPITKGKILFDKKEFLIFPKKKKGQINHYFTYIGISRYTKPQRHKLILSLKFKDGQTIKKQSAITIAKGHFKKSVLKFTGKKKKLAENKPLLRNESNLLTKHFKKKTSFKLFKTRFMIPTKGKTTTQFGAYRSYNGKPTGKHSGVDFANKVGTPIKAGNTGKVILSKSLKSHGHTIMIDHGVGVISIYNHLSKRLVKEGQKVKKGEKIALMGATGIATGSHLHWGLSIQNVRVDPLFWVKTPTLYK